MYWVKAEILNKENNKRIGFVLYDDVYKVERKEGVFGTQTWIQSGQVANMSFTKGGGFRMKKGYGTVAELPKVYIEVPKQGKGMSFKGKAKGCIKKNTKVYKDKTPKISKFGGCKKWQEKM